MAAPYPSSTKDTTLSACDDCRARKLKCSGEPGGCSRCETEKISCHYSLRKSMGRPRKRRREENQIEAAYGEHGGVQNIVHNGMGLEVNSSTTNTHTSAIGAGEGTYGLQSAINDLGDHGFQANDYGFQSPLVQDFPLWDFPQEPDTFLSMGTANNGQIQTPPDLYGDATGPSLAQAGPNGCACLGSLMSTLTTFQSLPTPSFPYSMGALRRATRCAFAVVRCTKCPQEYNTAVQNSMMLGALLQMLINEYAKLLKHIDERAASGEKIAFRVGEVTSCLDRRHTGGPDCPMAINIDLDGEEWRMLARKGVRQEVLGGTDNDECVANVVREMRDRQIVWHNSFSKGGHPGDGQEHSSPEREIQKDNGDPICVQLTYIDHLRRMLDGLKF